MSRMSLRPRNGWRPFLGEVGVIILGVLIALGLGVVATEIGWQVETRTARKSIGLELGEGVGQGLERVRFYGCVERRLDQLADVVDDSAGGRLPPLGDIAMPTPHTWNHGTWDSAVGAQTASHFGREELIAYVSAFEYVAGLGDTALEEFDAWTRLYVLVGPGRPLSSAEAGDLLRAISEARMINRRMARRGLLLSQLVDAYGLHADNAYKRAYLEKPLSTYPICQPIHAEVPVRYGQAPRDYTIEDVRKDPIIRIPL